MSRMTRSGAALVLGGAPRANLLPPEVLAAGKAHRTRRLLGLVVVLAIVVVGSAYGVVSLRAVAAQDELLAAQDRTSELLQAQAEFAEANESVAMVDAAAAARTTGASTEVLWDDLVDQIATRLPAGATLYSGTLTGRAPWEPELTPAGPLRDARVATLSLVVDSSALLDPVALIRGLADIPGFADATPDSVSVEEGVYKTTITINVGAEVLSGRFQETEPEE